MTSFQFIGTGLSSKNTYRLDVDICTTKLLKKKPFVLNERFFIFLILFTIGEFRLAYTVNVR